LNLIDIPVPVIAALNGATAVHSEYALLANIVIATPETVFQDKPHFAFGIVRATALICCDLTAAAARRPALAAPGIE
jgi:enoyl-CoA hydratase/carnithine racemase